VTERGSKDAERITAATVMRGVAACVAMMVASLVLDALVPVRLWLAVAIVGPLVLATLMLAGRVPGGDR
jgi:uncharacterized protein (DUF983 family)